MKVGLMGGTFDPVHKGHLKLAAAARKQLKLDRVYLVLTPRSPFKMNWKPSPLRQRLRWLTLAVKAHRGLGVGRWELKQKGPAYTVDLLKRYRRRNPNVSLFFIMGSDSWTGFKKWKNPRQIMNLSTIVIGRRPGAPLSKRMDKAVRVLKGVFPSISSTEIRRRAKSGRALSALLPPLVAAQIHRAKAFQ